MDEAQKDRTKNAMPTVALVVEDERPLLSAVAKKLELNGFEVVTARTVGQAVNYLEEVEGIKVIWLDHYLVGKENGLDLVVKIKNDPRWKNIPIFVVSNTATPEKKHAYIEFGIAKYYVKSDSRIDDIVADIKKILQEQDM